MSWVPEKVEIELRETEQGLRHFIIEDKPSIAAQNMTLTLSRLGVTSTMPLKEVRAILKDNNIKCAQDTLRASMHILKNNNLTTLATGGDVSSRVPSRSSRNIDDETRLDERLDSSHPETTVRLAHVSPRLDSASHETQTTLYKERLASDQPDDDPDDLGMF